MRRQRNNSSTPLVERQGSKVDAAIQFVTHWQDALAQKAAGNFAAVNNILQNLNKNSPYPILSQEEIHAHLIEVKTSEATVAESPKPNEPPELDPGVVGEVLHKAKTLDDLAGTLSELRKIAPDSSTGRRGGPNTSSAVQEAAIAIGFLQTLTQAYADYQQGFYARSLQAINDSRNSGQYDWMPEIARLQGMFLNLLMPKYLGMPEKSKPSPGENCLDFLLRMAREAREDGRWADVRTALDVYRDFGFTGNGIAAPVWLGIDINNCQDFITAQNLEKTGDLVGAIVIYQRVLKRLGNLSPTPETVARLQELEKDHPDIYQAAIKQVDSDPNYEAMHEQLLKEVDQMIHAEVGQRGVQSSPGVRRGFNG